MNKNTGKKNVHFCIYARLTDTRGRRHKLTLQMRTRLQINTNTRTLMLSPLPTRAHAFFSLLMCGPGCKFLGSFMLIPISISGVNKALQLGLMRLYHREGSSEVGGGWMTQSPSSKGGKESDTKNLQVGILRVFGCFVATSCLRSGSKQNKSLKEKRKIKR